MFIPLLQVYNGIGRIDFPFGGKTMSTLIVYTSKYGSTEKCAKQLAEQLTDSFELVDSVPDLSLFDSIIIGSPIYMGKSLKEADLPTK